ncbi:hypothetical protein K1719_045751 [Acacia pycnantha]|nr:hypothetical protein K1719_045751 [Acacia pycnantha]
MIYMKTGSVYNSTKIANNRLRKFGEIKDVFENNKGYGEIEAIVMDNYYDEDKIRCIKICSMATFSFGNFSTSIGVHESLEVYQPRVNLPIS